MAAFLVASRARRELMRRKWNSTMTARISKIPLFPIFLKKKKKKKEKDAKSLQQQASCHRPST
jgi:hypothetical protein